MLPYRALLFDADNTLLDFDKAERNAFLRLLQSSGIDESRFPEYYPVYRSINLSCWKELEKGHLDPTSIRAERFRRFLSACRLHVPFDAKEASRIYESFLEDQSDIVETADVVLGTLHQRFPIYILTNGFRFVQRKRIMNSAVSSMIDGIFVSEEIGYSKPDERFYEFVIRSCGFERLSECLVIGDSISSDMTGAQKCGFATCWYNPNGERPPEGFRSDFTITRLTDLLTILEGKDT